MRNKFFLISFIIVIFFNLALADDLKVVFIDVGQGDGIFIHTPENKNILIDGGYDDKVFKYLKKEKINRIDYILFSHSHPDHTGGLIPVLSSMEIKKVYSSNYYTEEDKEYIECFDIVYRKAIPFEKIHSKYKLNWDKNLDITIFSPKAGKMFNKTNDNSIVIKLRYNKVSFMFTGDIEMEAEKSLVKEYGANLSADILKVPHHGSYSSSTYAFVRSVRPKFAVISCSLNNDFGHPSSSILARYRKRGVKILRTDYNGSITFITDGNFIKFETQK